MKKIIFSILLLVVTCDLFSQVFDSVQEVKQYVEDSITRRPEKIRASTLYKAYKGTLDFVPVIVNDTAVVSDRRHGQIYFQRKDSTCYIAVQGLSGFIPVAPIAWGRIKGNLSNQTDLQNALDAKLDSIHIYTASGTDPDTLYQYKAGDSALRGYIHKEATTATNGLTQSGNNILLGGTLTQNTFIEANNKDFLVTQGRRVALFSQHPSDPNNYAELNAEYGGVVRMRNNESTSKRTDILLFKQGIVFSVDYDLATYINTMRMDTTFSWINSRFAVYDQKQGHLSISDDQLQAALTVFGNTEIKDSLKVGDLPDGVATDDMVVWSSADSLMKKIPAFTSPVTTSADANLTLDKGSVYVFTGTTTTWTLPAVSGTTGRTYWIKNRGSGNITLNADSGNNEIYDSAATNTITIPPGNSARLVSDGTYFLVL